MNDQISNQGSIARLFAIFSSADYNEKKLFFTMLFSLYLALSLIRFNWPAHLFMSFIITALGIFALILLSIRIRREYVPIYIFVGFLITSFLVSTLFVSRAERIGHVVLFIVFNTGIALILLRGYVYSWGAYIVFYGLVGYFLMLMLTGIDPRDALVCSYNGISVMLLAACIPLYIILTMENRKIDFIPALLTLLISIWGIGRSGIVSSCVLLFGLLFVRLRAKPKHIHIGIISLIISSIIIYSFFDVLSTQVMDSSFFSNAINNYLARNMDPRPSERMVIWTNYFNNLDLSRILFGVNVLEDAWPDGERLAYNYHNTFINLHLQTGFMGLIVLALMIFSLFTYFRTNQVFFILLLAVILRWSTDIGLFFESWDFIPLFFIFYFLSELHFRVYPRSSHIMETNWGKLDSNIGGEARSIMRNGI